MTPTEVKDLHDAFKAFKEFSDSAATEQKRLGTVTSDLQAKLDRVHSDLDRFEGLLMKRSPFTNAFDDGGTRRSKSEDVKSFLNVLRGKQAASPEHKKALIEGSDPAGGYLAPTDLVEDLLKNVVEFSPIRSIAGRRPTSRMAIQIPKRLSTASASWVTETGTRSETTNPTFGLSEIRPHEAYALTKISRAELEDSAFPLDEFLRAEFGEQFGVLEGSAFVAGDGNGKPEGYLVNPSIQRIASGHASQVTADSLFGLYFGLKEAYLSDSTWVFSRDTLRIIRTLKDGQGRYLLDLEGGIRTGTPPLLLGRPYITAIDMPAVQAGSFPVAFGSFKRGYLIVDRLDMEFMVDPISSKSTGLSEISARRRVGGSVVLPEALKILEIAAS